MRRTQEMEEKLQREAEELQKRREQVELDRQREQALQKQKLEEEERF